MNNIWKDPKVEPIIKSNIYVFINKIHTKNYTETFKNGSVFLAEACFKAKMDYFKTNPIDILSIQEIEVYNRHGNHLIKEEDIILYCYEEDLIKQALNE